MGVPVGRPDTPKTKPYEYDIGDGVAKLGAPITHGIVLVFGQALGASRASVRGTRQPSLLAKIQRRRLRAEEALATFTIGEAKCPQGVVYGHISSLASDMLPGKKAARRYPLSRYGQ